MKKLLTLTLSLSLLFAYSIAASAQDSSTTSKTPQISSSRKRGPVFRANKEQINQAQVILKSRGLYSGGPPANSMTQLELVLRSIRKPKVSR